MAGRVERIADNGWLLTMAFLGRGGTSGMDEERIGLAGRHGWSQSSQLQLAGEGLVELPGREQASTSPYLPYLLAFLVGKGGRTTESVVVVACTVEMIGQTGGRADGRTGGGFIIFLQYSSPVLFFLLYTSRNRRDRKKWVKGANGIMNRLRRLKGGETQ